MEILEWFCEEDSTEFVDAPPVLLYQDEMVWENCQDKL
jgi:hypothetical protein